MSINEKLGLRHAATRHMMRLPKNRAEAAELTSAKCPLCERRGIIEHKVHGALLRMCPWCMASWRPDDPAGAK